MLSSSFSSSIFFIFLRAKTRVNSARGRARETLQGGTDRFSPLPLVNVAERTLQQQQQQRVPIDVSHSLALGPTRTATPRWRRLSNRRATNGKRPTLSDDANTIAPANNGPCATHATPHPLSTSRRYDVTRPVRNGQTETSIYQSLSLNKLIAQVVRVTRQSKQVQLPSDA